MSRDLDLTLLRAFLAIVEAGSITAASSKLGRTQAAISQQLKRLEEDLGVVLLSRSARGVVLTEPGAKFFRHARQVMQAADAARQAVSDFEPQTFVRVGVLEDLMTKAFARRITGLKHNSAFVRFDVTCGCGPVLEKKLQSGEIDLLISEVNGMKAEPVKKWHDELCWVSKTSRPVRPSNELSLIVFDLNEPCVWRDAALALLDQSGIPWKVVLSSSALLPVVSGLRAGLGAAIMLKSFAVDIDLQIVAPQIGLPSLPNVELGIFCSPFFPDQTLARWICAELIDEPGDRNKEPP